MIFRVLLVVSLSLYVSANGFDLMSCDTMNPSGGVPAQTTPSPYEISLSASQYQDGFPVTVTLEANGTSVTFADYFIIARCDTCANTSVPVGAFTIGQEVAGQVIPCYASLGAVASTDLMSKTSVTVKWTPSKGMDETVTMVASVVKSSNTWWGGIQSVQLQRKTSLQIVRGPPTTTTTTTSATTTASSGRVAGCWMNIVLFITVFRFL